MTKRLGRNALCWCGSGKKYKKCHLNRVHEKELPLGALQQAVSQAWKHEKCFHPLAGAGICDAIISAHSIQRSRVLDKIIDDRNHVLSFYPARVDKRGIISVSRVGWKKASTFTGFCAKHDRSTFDPIENQEFEGSEQQCFLLGYRALCHELYQKTAAIKSSPVIRAMIDRGREPSVQREIQNLQAVLVAGQRVGLANSEALKASMDAQLLSQNYGGWSRAVVNFDGELCISSTGAITPNRNLDGKSLQVLHQDELPLEYLLCGVVATPMGGAMVLTWPTGQKAPEAFVASLLRHDESLLPGILVQFLFAFIENTFFSERWWKSLSDQEQRHLTARAHLGNPYYDNLEFISNRFVPWKITKITRQ